MHNDLLRIIMRNSVSRFFDVTPIGRLLNHFSGDMEVIDGELPATVDGIMTFMFSVFQLFSFLFLQFFFISNKTQHGLYEFSPPPKRKKNSIKESHNEFS